MNVLQNVRSFLSGYFQTKTPPNLENVDLVDVYLENLITICCGKDIAYTLQSFFGVNLCIFLILLWSPNFYGTVGIVALLLFVYDWMYRESLYAKYTGQYRDVQESFRITVQNFISYLCTLRKEHQHIFYPLMMIFFWSLLCISDILKMVAYLLAVVLLASVVKVLILYLPEPILSKISSVLDDKDFFFIHSISSFIRKEGCKNSVAVSSRAIPDQADSFISGLSSMPSYLEVAESPVEIEEEDLLPQTAAAAISITPGDLSSDSDSDNKDIKFDSDHFNTSSSEDDPLVKNFPTIKNEQVGMFRSVMNTVGGNIVASMFQSAVYSRTPESRKRIPSETDSSDFELVDAEDIDNEMKKST